jgi:RNA polymerase sigma-70 factor (ECF subfamily)
MEAFLASIERRAFLMAKLATGDVDEAMDIVQDAMLALVKKYRHKPEHLWKPLFYRILQNRIRDWYRRSQVKNRWRIWLRRHNQPEDRPDGDPLENVPAPRGERPDNIAMQDQTFEALAAALRQLPLRQQQAFLLRTWEGLDVSETAAAMRCSAGSVKTHYSRAVKALRSKLEEHWP